MASQYAEEWCAQCRGVACKAQRVGVHSAGGGVHSAGGGVHGAEGRHCTKQRGLRECGS